MAKYIDMKVGDEAHHKPLPITDELNHIELNLELIHNYKPGDRLCLQLSQFPEAAAQLQKLIQAARVEELEDVKQTLGRATETGSWNRVFSLQKHIEIRLKALTPLDEDVVV